MKKTILIIEDRTEFIMLLFSIVEDFSKIIFTRTLEDAREMLANRIPDIILLDNQLPDGLGINFCSELKSNEQLNRIPIIMITGNTEEEFKQSAFNAGVVDFIKKPYNLNDARMRIKSQLGI